MKISVIIPVRNEAQTIRPLLERLKSQTQTPAEIIITDTGSTDGTPEIIEELGDGVLPVHLVRAGSGYPGRGRNLGAARAENEWLAFIDAGVIPESGWLGSLAQAVDSADNVDVVYGSFQPVTETFFKECAAIAYVPPPAMVEGHPMRTRSIACALMRRSVWQSAGGFPEDLRSAEDLLFMDRIQAGGANIAYAPNALVHWNLQPTFGKTFSRFVTYSRNNIRAGLWAQWQRTIVRRYLFLLLLALPVFVGGRWWLLYGLGLPVVTWLLMLVVRSIIAIRRNRYSFPAGPGRNLRRLFLLVPLLAVIDLAAIVGSLQWLLSDRSFSSAEGASVHHDA